MIYKRTDAYGKEAPNTGMNYKGNENQNPNEYHSYLIQEVSVDEDVEKLEPLCNGISKRCNHYENSMEVPKK
jgi:hypothetical protein